MNYKILIKFLFLATVVIFVVCPFFAEAKRLEIDYPNLSESAPAPQSTKTLLPDYIKYLFIFSLRIAGIVCFLALVYGGFLYVSSVGNPSQMGEAQQQILNSLIGLIIILASYLLLNTINPELIILKGPQINSGNLGIIVFDSENCEGTAVDYTSRHFYASTTFGNKTICGTDDCGDDEKDQKDYWINHAKSIKFLNKPTEVRIKYAEQTNPDKLIKIDFQRQNECKPLSVSNLKKITFEYNLPGVYLYKDNNCENEFIYYQTSTAGFPTAPVDWVNKVRCLKIVNTKESNYVAVLHDSPNYKGKCKEFIGKKEPNPDNFDSVDKFPSSSPSEVKIENKMASVKNSFALARVSSIAEIDPTQTIDENQSSDPTQTIDENPSIDPTQTPGGNPNEEIDATQLAGSLPTQFGFEDMAESLTIFEIPKQKRNDSYDQGVILSDWANKQKPVLKLLGSFDNKKDDKVVYYAFDNESLTFYDCDASGNCPTQDKTFAIDQELKKSCNSTCVGIRDLISIEKRCSLGGTDCLEINDRITSFDITPGYVAILWEELSYGGVCEVFSGSEIFTGVSDLTGHDLGKCFKWFTIGSSDCTSYIKVFQKK